MSTFVVILLVGAVVVLGLAAFNVTARRVNLFALGVFLFVLATAAPVVDAAL